MPNENLFFKDFKSRPLGYTFQIATVILGVGYLWMFTQLAPIIKDQAVMATKIENMEKSLVRIEGKIDAKTALIGPKTNEANTNQSTPTSLVIQPIESKVLPVDTTVKEKEPSATPVAKIEGGPVDIEINQLLDLLKTVK